MNCEMVLIRAAQTSSSVEAAEPDRRLKQLHPLVLPQRNGGCGGSFSPRFLAASPTPTEMAELSLAVGAGLANGENTVDVAEVEARGGEAVVDVEEVPSTTSRVEGEKKDARRETGGALNKKELVLSRGGSLLGFATFVFCGVASLVCWQFLLGMLPYIEKHIYNGTPYGNSILGAYQLGCIAVQVAFILFTDAMKPGLVVGAVLFDALLAALLPLVLTQTYSSQILSATLFHFAAIAFGAAAGVVTGGSIAVASALPFGFIGAFSVGQGVCGIFAFVVNFAASSFLFDLSTFAGTRNMLWLVFLSSAMVSVLSACLLALSLRQAWVRAVLDEFWKAKQTRAAAAAAEAEAAASLSATREEVCCAVCQASWTPPPPADSHWRRFKRRWNGVPEEGIEREGVLKRVDSGATSEAGESAVSLLPSRGWKAILASSWVFLLCIFSNFFVTLNLYPRVGPISWHYEGFSAANEQYLILFGVFCLGDLIGKALPDLARVTPWLRFLKISPKVLPFVVGGRVFLGVFFVLGMTYSHHAFFNAFAWYVVLVLALAITNGACATCGIMHACESVPRFEEKEIVGPASVLMILLGIACGVYSAYLY